MPTRRHFLATSAACFLGHRLVGQAAPTRLNVAEIDREFILAAAETALQRPVQPNGDLSSTAFLNLTLDIPALAAAFLLTREASYPAAAKPHLEAWFTDPRSRLTLAPKEPAEVAVSAALAEVALSLPFLFSADGVEPYTPWFSERLTTLQENRVAGLARDMPDHAGAAWLLQVSALAHLLRDGQALADARHRFSKQTLRAQINSTGAFPHELTTANPFRNSLFTLDLLAGVCVLLSTPYDSLWNLELQDGPGMRAAIAHHAPFLERPSTWPYPADTSHFHDLPCRRPALLFAARAYSVPEYAALWKSLKPAQPSSPELLLTFPIRQPVLWQTQPRTIL